MQRIGYFIKNIAIVLPILGNYLLLQPKLKQITLMENDTKHKIASVLLPFFDNYVPKSFAKETTLNVAESLLEQFTIVPIPTSEDSLRAEIVGCFETDVETANELIAVVNKYYTPKQDNKTRYQLILNILNSTLGGNHEVLAETIHVSLKD